MRIMYQQPHLVPPMKLTVFDDLPPTPTPAPPSRLSRWVSLGKISLRSSLSTRTHISSRHLISSPRPPLPSDDQLPLRRPSPNFRPLELSIYMPNNRLSDLPEFDRLSFTDVGEIKLPPRALMRTKSEELMSNKLLSMMPVPVKPASMIEQRRTSHARPDTSSTVISTSRPPSEYDALHSHPISWASLPGLPPQAHALGRSEPSVAILTPMEEEFSTPNTSVTVNGVVLEFPKLDDRPVAYANQELTCSANEAAAPFVPSTATRNFSKPVKTEEATGYFHPNYQTQKRISQWLAHRQSSSLSTTKTSSTSSSSFVEHRRKRSHFYQLSAVPPKPLDLWSHKHQRTVTQSTVVSTVDTDILSLEEQSQTDTSVATPTDAQSRAGTTKCMAKGLTPIMSGVPDIPPGYAEVLKEADDLIIREIGGPLRSPGVGVAF